MPSTPLRPARRALPSRTIALPVLAAVLAASGTAGGAQKNWNAGNGNWSAAGNWSPIGMPGPADFVSIGNLGPAENDTVTLDVNANAATLSMTDGMTLDTNGKQISVAGPTLVSGHNQAGPLDVPSRLLVKNGAAPYEFIGDALTLSDGATLEIRSGVLVLAQGLLDVDDTSTIDGFGGAIVLVGNGAAAMKLNGNLVIRPQGLALSQIGLGFIDLDGDVAGDRTIDVTAVSFKPSGLFATLTVAGDQLTDPFDDDLWIGAQNVLTMDLDAGWTMGPGATMTFFTSQVSTEPAQVNGTAFTMNGSMAFDGLGAHAQINAPLVLTPTAQATLGPDARLECNGPVTLNGGSYTLDAGATVDFDGATTVHGGGFSTDGVTVADGTINFNGPTTWAGGITVNGVARQIGDASVTAATTIDATVFDMDGAGSASWSIGNSLVVNAAHLDTTGNSAFGGSISSSGTFFGKLTINLDQPGDRWTMAGTMSLGGVGALQATRVSGSEMRLTGDLDITGKVQITADTVITEDATVSLPLPTTELRLAGTSIVEAGATMSGQGVLANAASGDMTLANGVGLGGPGGIGLTNAGVLRIGTAAGEASVDRFQMTGGATWIVELGGTLPGVGHDQLNVLQDEAALAGSLVVTIIDDGGDLFEPEVGDLFAILQAPGSVTGTFANEPVSFVPGRAYLWNVAYFPSEVVLQLDAIVPCAADLSGDGVVDGADLGLLLGAWGPCDDCLADLNGDGAVDGADLGGLLGAWGPCPL